MPARFGQFKTLFVSSGLKTAMLVTSINGLMQKKPKRIANAHAALDWCEANGAMMVFTPARADQS